MQQMMRQCIDTCQNCHGTCLETISQCLKLGGEYSHAAHIRLLQDCVQICATSADFMLRELPLHVKTCGVCADICAQCADECRKMAGDDPQMKTCADTCALCSETCRTMSKMAA